MRREKHFEITVLAFMAIWAAMLGVLLGSFYNRAHAAQEPPQTQAAGAGNASLDKETGGGRKGDWTLAVFGLDSRDGSLGRGNQSDLEMIVNIDWETGEIRLVSLYRDTYLKIDENGAYSKINQAYCNGGHKQAVKALSENLDLKIDDYASFNWKAVVDAINLLGGIDLEVSREEFKVINGFITETVKSTKVPSTQLKKAGMNHLDGVQAVAYARLRKMDTDFKRTERQRKVVKLVLEKARKADFSVINHILVSVLPQISTSIGLGDLLPLAENIKKFHLAGAEGFPFELEDVILDHRDCVVPVTLEDNVKKLHQFLFEDEQYSPSKRVRAISREIEKRVSEGKKKKT